MGKGIIEQTSKLPGRLVLLTWLTLATLPALAVEQPQPIPAGQSLPAPTIITHKLPDVTSHVRELHEVDVLRLALEKTVEEYGPFELRGIPPMNRARALAALHTNTYPNLVLQMSYDDDMAGQENLAYIPFPLDRGALSYRICFMRDDIKPLVKEITRIAQLQNFTFGTGIGWADTKVLRHNHLQVIEASNVVSLFRMTKASRVDLFCRGPSEYFYEQQHESSLGLTSDKHLALYYPLPKFFFVHKGNHALLHRVKKGLDIAYKDGSFNKLWRERHGKGIKAANLKQRNIVKMENPLIKHLPRDYEIYLFDPLTQQ